MHLLKILLAGSLFINGCRTIAFDEFRPEMPNSRLLPSLHVHIDTLSLESFYWNDQSTHAFFDDHLNPPPFRHRYIRDIRVQDAITLFERDVKDNLTNPIGHKFGFITCKVVTGECRYSAVNTFVSVATLFIPNIFGMPFNSHMTHLELEVEVYDSRQHLLGRYAATGSSKVPIALWRGYRTADAYRLSNIKAFKAAMRRIKEKIAKDYEAINQELFISGPVSIKQGQD